MNQSKCNHDAQDVVLLFYNELPEDRAADVNARLSVCASCREVLAGLKAVGNAVPRTPTVHIEQDAIDAIRRSTAGQLRQLGRGDGVGHTGFWSGLLARPAFTAPAIAVVAILAFLSGLLVRPTSVDLPQKTATAGDVVYVSSISANDDGTLSVSYSAAREETAVGSLDDPVIQRLLGRALLDGSNPVTRLRAANVIADMETGGSKRTDPELTLALASVLAGQDNVGIRLQAMQAASNLHPALPLPDYMIDVLTDILQTEANSALRIQALRLLTNSEIASMRLASILESARDDSNAFVRIQARDRLRQLGDTVPLEQMDTGNE